MAKKPKRITDTEINESRTDVTWRNALLLSAFGVLVVISVFTVMIPELTDDGADEEADAAGTASTEEAPAPTTPPASAAP
jgi:hypothetical protein